MVEHKVENNFEDKVEYNPYDWKIHEDPYPTYAALRSEAPAYYNEEIDFWALSRHADVPFIGTPHAARAHRPGLR